MSFIGDDFWSWAFDQLQELGAIEEAAEQAWDMAIDACGNEGQVSIIDMTGYDAFQAAAESSAEGNSMAYDILIGACPYPEAVSGILGDAAGLIHDVINDNLSDARNEVDEALDPGDSAGAEEDWGGDTLDDEWFD